ncbi:SRA stem-loop-interacting RNA-binding protein, mitochondrial [Pyxicephalus adspersus]|uniref:RRM domain-containing protein n=1 Tax=Pyxicephalus adspersus TaxID=30357 RepID=A0AAV2ZES2_PYXAD|nr:TPA: hypothetical protein GDO54_005563 [Pyxicephalus adspersus]
MAAAGKSLCEIFVHRIPFTVGTRELREYFSQFGRVVRCDIHLNKATGFHKGFGWVAYANESTTRSVLQMNDHTLDGYKIQIQQQEQKYTKTSEDINV